MDALADSSHRDEILHLTQLVQQLAVISDSADKNGKNASDDTGNNVNNTSGINGTVANNTGNTVKSVANSLQIDNFDTISYIIKQIFQTAKQEAFTEQLNLFIHRKESEIERMCNFHYQEFVQSVDQLLKVRAGAVHLKNNILELNQDLQVTGGRIIEKKREVIDYRRRMLNVEATIDMFQQCTFVLEIANKVNLHIENRKFYAALRLLEEIQSTHLRTVAQYEFAKHMMDCIPKLRENIKEEVSKDMREWHLNVRESTRTIGRLCLELTAISQVRTRMRKSGSGALSAKDFKDTVLSSDLLAVDDGETNILDNKHVRLDFKPLHSCLHIFDALGKRNEFKRNYEESRKLQANLIISTPFSLKNSDLTGFETYLQDVIGFFAIEAIVMNTTEDFRSRGSVQALWEVAMEKIKTVIRDSLQDCDMPELFLTIKIRLTVFIQALENYGYSVTKLTDLILSLFDRYSEMMKSSCSEAVSELIDSDEYSPMTINNYNEYEHVNKAFELCEELDQKGTLSFPRSVPFSKGFPQCCERIQSFITGFYRFAEGFSTQYGEMDDLLKKSLDSLLIQHVNGALLRQLITHNLSQAVQIRVNLDYWELACPQFEVLLMERRCAHRGGKIALQAQQAFKNSKKAAETRIIELINGKIDQFLEVADYDWTPAQAAAQPSTWLSDLAEITSTVIASTVTNLPGEAKELVYHDAFTHLADALMQLMLNPSVKKMNLSFIAGFVVDVNFLKRFVAALGMPSLGDAFEELLQTLSFLRVDNYEPYFISGYREQTYPRMRAGNAVALLEKIKGESSAFGNFQTPAAEKAKRKTLDTLIKLLKEQVARVNHTESQSPRRHTILY
ncbi:hypothetical protein SeLEV6574_g01846 [Synchytrium endobioticum]|nr:hypothetical protein SeLEV6574_g01846 [Synchytrium endobioticum]